MAWVFPASNQGPSQGVPVATYLSRDEHLRRVVTEVLASHSANTPIAIIVTECMNRTCGDRLDSETDGEYRMAFGEIADEIRHGPEPEAVKMARYFRGAYTALIAETKAVTNKERGKCRFRAVHHTLRAFGKATKGVPLPRSTFVAYLRMLSQAERELSARDGTALEPPPAERQGRLLKFPAPTAGGKQRRQGGDNTLPTPF